MITRTDTEKRLEKALARQGWEISSPIGLTMKLVVEDIRQDMEQTIEDAFKDGYEKGFGDRESVLLGEEGSGYLDIERYEEWIRAEKGER